ncbi:Protein kinase domain-containing protein [Aphelenchoides besseyi]|nr:Protein kinase domain-containing protein [Aphelenchoides besseyi]
MEGIEFVMKLCDSDNPNAHLLFLQQFAFLREFREAFAGHPQRSHFPEYLGSGAFDQLCYKDNYAEDDAKIFMVLPRPHPRPYLLVERIGLTIEQLMRGNQFGLLDISTARFITIGCIQTLRLMHEMGWVHRCVANYTFALRVGSNGFMSDLDLNLNVVCVDAGFPRRFRSVNHPPRRVAPFAGTYKYSSIAAMENKEQMPNDDLISALYLFCEMIHGQLPWRGVHNLEKIMDMKKKLQDDPPIRIDNTGHREFPIDLRRLPQAFNRIAEYIVYRDLYTIINVIAEINRHTITEENVNKKFRNLTDAILDRGQPPAAVDQLQQQAKQQTPGTKGVHNQETQPAAQPPPVGVAKDKNHDPTATPTETRSGRSKKKQNQKASGH